MKRRSFINKLVQGTAIVGAGLSEKLLLSETIIPEPYHGQRVELRLLDNGDKVWYLNGKIHREDGPAVVVDLSNGN